MGFMGDCCLVRCKLDDDELLCQLAEEAVELAVASGKCRDLDFYSEEGKALIEEIADVELVTAIFLNQIELELLEAFVLHETDKEKAIFDFPGIATEVIRCYSEKLAKASLKLRRARNKNNPTPITEDEAKEDMLFILRILFSIIQALNGMFDLSKKVEAIKIQKVRRWAERLTEGIK